MALTSQFTRNVKSYVTQHPILVNESAVQTQRDTDFAALPGNHKVLTAGNWVKEFTLTSGPFEHSLVIHAGHVADSEDCYFLPYLPDHAITMTLGNAADWFFTSTLTGCTVQVNGPAATPRVTHANARTRYNNEVQNLRPKDANGANEDWQHVTDAGKAYVDITAASRAQQTIDAMLPAIPGGQASGVLKRTAYVAKVNHANLGFGKQHFSGPKRNYSLAADVGPSMTPSGKPEVGVFVFGYRKAGAWKFYYQATVAIVGHFDVWRFRQPNKQKQAFGHSIVLGTPTKIFG
jgi:hypothetical protein